MSAKRRMSMLRKAFSSLIFLHFTAASTQDPAPNLPHKCVKTLGAQRGIASLTPTLIVEPERYTHIPDILYSEEIVELWNLWSYLLQMEPSMKGQGQYHNIYNLAAGISSESYALASFFSTGEFLVCNPNLSRVISADLIYMRTHDCDGFYR